MLFVIFAVLTTTEAAAVATYPTDRTKPRHLVSRQTIPTIFLPTIRHFTSKAQSHDCRDSDDSIRY